MVERSDKSNLMEKFSIMIYEQTPMLLAFFGKLKKTYC